MNHKPEAVWAEKTLRDTVAYAYMMGYHEVGVDPVSELIEGMKLSPSVPENVREAIERMSIGIDPSWGIPATTAELDSACMKTIREYVLGPDKA